MIPLGQRLLAILSVLFVALALLAPPAAHAGAYEAELPANLTSTPDMCSLLPCTEVFPGATHFSERKGQPPYVEAYDNDSAQKKLLGYVMLSTDITDTPAYSG
ncbi:MAG: 4Fe-4S binding protein, partial [Proteobacteria bacterium]|nr:4Fe-4S binding protein [Pseudomonadota bacterium]